MSNDSPRFSGSRLAAASTPPAACATRPILPRSRTPASRGRWSPPRCTTDVWDVPRSRDLRRERMLDLVALGDDLGDLRLARNGTRDGFLGGLVVVLLDLLVVGGVPVDEHADA